MGVIGPKKRRYWIGRSKADLKEFPERVQQSVGFALWGAQEGETPQIIENGLERNISSRVYGGI